MDLKEGVKVFIIVLICILVLGFLLYFAMKLISDSNQDNLNQNQSFNYSKVVEIIDGDTFKLGNGEIVRLLCVDTPEKNQDGYDGAISFLGERLLYSDSEIRLEGNKTDKYGRSLRWVYADDVLINKEIVYLGFGIFF